MVTCKNKSPKKMVNLDAKLETGWLICKMWSKG